MEITIRVSPEDIAAAVMKAGGIAALPAEPRKPGRPKKAKPDDVEPDDVEPEDDETTDDDVETTDDDDVEGDDEPEVVVGEQLAKVKTALQAYSKAKKSKDAAVKILHKFAKSSEKVLVSDYKKLLTALKV